MQIINYGNHTIQGVEPGSQIKPFERADVPLDWLHRAMRKGRHVLPVSEFEGKIKSEAHNMTRQRVKNRAKFAFGTRSAAHMAWIAYVDKVALEDISLLHDVLLAEDFDLPPVAEEPVVEPAPVAEVDSEAVIEEVEEQPKPRRRRRRKAEAAE